MTTKAQAAPTIEWDAVEGGNTEFTESYPRFQWVHGNKQSAGFMKTGGLFISAEQYPNFTADGFAPTTLITREGTEIEGYGASAAKLAVIRVKQQWIHDDEYNRNVPLRQALVCIKGCDELVVLSLKGAAKAMRFQNAFNQHIAQNVALANRTRPQGTNPLEPFALWFPVRAAEQQMASAKNSSQSSAVTPPEMVTPETLDRDHVASLWVGKDNYKQFAAFYRDTKAWQGQPIWEQKANEAEAAMPTHTGDDRASQEQVDFIGGLIETKGLDTETIKEFCLQASDGATNQLGNLTKAEASEFIEIAKSY